MSTPTPADAIAAYWVIETRLHTIPPGEAADHLRAIADRLRTWGQQQLQTEHEEGEMPSQTGFLEPECGTLGSVNEAVPGVQKHPRDLTASPRPTEPGDEQL